MAYALQFDGANSIVIPDAADLDLIDTTGWTIWFRAKVLDNSGTSVNAFLDIEDGSFLADYAMLAIGNASYATSYVRNSFYASLKDHATNTKTIYGPAATIPNTDYVTYFISHDATTAYAGFCENGGTVSQLSEASPVVNILGKRWYIGAKTDGSIPLKAGTLIESFGVSAGKMTDAEIEAVAAGTAFDATTATVVRYYEMNEGSGSVINDKANTGNSAYQGAFTGLTWVNLGGGGTTVNATAGTAAVTANAATINNALNISATVASITVTANSASIAEGGDPSITTEPLKNNTGSVLSGQTVTASVYNITTGALVVRKTGLTSDGSGIVTFTDAALSAATNYQVVLTIGSADGVARITTG